ncbi:MAG TPA: hypothetical protein VFW08_01930 [bacterium]|nr:hypothetical protein [bacterium]
MIPQDEVIGRLEQVIARIDPRLVLDRGNVRAMTDPYPGVEYGLRLGEAAALLFMPEADLAASDWESRVFKRLEAARKYLEGFAHRYGGDQTPPETRRVLHDRPRAAPRQADGEPR